MKRRDFLTKVTAGLALPVFSSVADPAGGINDSAVIDHIIKTVNEAKILKSFGLPKFLETKKIIVEDFTPQMTIKGRLYLVDESELGYNERGVGLKTFPQGLPINEKTAEILKPHAERYLFPDSPQIRGEMELYRQVLGVGVSSLIFRMENKTHDLDLEMNVVNWDTKERQIKPEGIYSRPTKYNTSGEDGILYLRAFSVPFEAIGSHKRDPIKLGETPKKKEILHDAVINEDKTRRET